MFLHALATAVPAPSFTPPQCWAIVERSGVRSRLSRRAMLTLHSILRSDHGIATRHFAVGDVDHLFNLGADELNREFRRAAPALAGRALAAALDRASLRAADVDALLVCTCTGYLCPGLTSYIAEELGLPTDAFLQDLVGLGCGAAIPTLRAASHIAASQPAAVIACVAVEICSAAFYLDDDPGVLISACLFADGAAASIWRGTPGPHALRAFGFDTVLRPGDRDKIRFEQRDGKLRNLLHRSVPELAASAVNTLWQRRGARPVARVVAHPGGRDVLEALAPVFAPHSLTASAEVLRAYGNMSSPSVLFALERTLRDGNPTATGDFWLTSFGAGFSAHSCRIGL
ncbi:MAG TPA: 3-oxoacyl-[acyl-carrier-protein] synthase III C-terminal domain-containing protein [Opitutus sp.]|nr:3-oxoacyl-[acyl-carrier-protein] synthase III C-terminal domain-containing protein [Opitutus sp.]